VFHSLRLAKTILLRAYYDFRLSNMSADERTEYRNASKSWVRTFACERYELGLQFSAKTI
jgi:hypothetical protein